MGINYYVSYRSSPLLTLDWLEPWPSLRTS